MRRGEIWWASLPLPHGSSPGFRRPVVVAQANPFNESRIQTVVVVAITSNLHLAAAPGNVPVTARESGLPRKSVVNVSQILTVDKALLTKRIGSLTGASLDRLDSGLRLVLSLRA
ncbi:MAG TPA: type II toxin-antitoxin system PemK/MazF family toxin [Thermoanaerobaculia bacterium]|nr:type II toxin-antitoxin system PemK/MazF family toxin [Thermoanaerobaculia bacterium]